MKCSLELGGPYRTLGSFRLKRFAGEANPEEGQAPGAMLAHRLACANFFAEIL